MVVGVSRDQSSCDECDIISQSTRPLGGETSEDVSLFDRERLQYFSSKMKVFVGSLFSSHITSHCAMCMYIIYILRIF